MNSGNLLNDLVRTGKLKRQNTNSEYLNSMIDSAKRNYDAAIMVSGKIDEAAFKLIYDAMLQIGRVVLLINGYRPNDGEQHKTTFVAAGHIPGKEYQDIINKIQRFRIKRNDCIYEAKGFITTAETGSIFKTFKEFWAKVRAYLEAKNPRLKLFKDI